MIEALSLSGEEILKQNIHPITPMPDLMRIMLSMLSEVIQ